MLHVTYVTAMANRAKNTMTVYRIRCMAAELHAFLCQDEGSRLGRAAS